MKAFDALLETFDRAFARFEESAAIRFLNSAEFSVEHYASVLREIYFYTRDNPQLQCAMTLSFRGPQRAAVRRIVGHALDEVGHEQMALRDLQSLGYDTSGIESEEALPSTIPLIAHPVYLLQSSHAVAYLGQIFFLEFMPTRSGKAYLAALARAGVPEAATSFLAEHASVDEHHNRLMQRHVADLIRTEEDLARCQTAIETTAFLYAVMLEGALEAGPEFARKQPRLEQEVTLEA